MFCVYVVTYVVTQLLEPSTYIATQPTIVASSRSIHTHAPNLAKSLVEVLRLLKGPPIAVSFFHPLPPGEILDPFSGGRGGLLSESEYAHIF